MLAGARACTEGADAENLRASLRRVSDDDCAVRPCRVAAVRFCRRALQNADGGGGGAEVQNREALAAIIKSKTEAYILDKAQELGLDVSADVTVEMKSAYPYPAFVQITGAFTPQQQEALTRYIEENLAIGKEQQVWTNE